MAGAMAYQQLNAKLQGLRIAPSRTVSRMRAAPAPVAQRRCRLVVQARTFEVGVGVFGTKAGMTQMFTASGSAARPATVIAIEPGNIVTQVKTRDTDGYDAVQVRVTLPRSGSGTCTCCRCCFYSHRTCERSMGSVVNISAFISGYQYALHSLQ